MAASAFAQTSEINEKTEDERIKAFCIDFNRGGGGPNGFAAPGLWADADPAEYVAWYKGLGANVVQTFCVSCKGHAWYKGGVVPEQPVLKHDFLSDVVRLGRREGMKVMGYFCVGANTRWTQEHPDQSYGNPSHTHIPFTTQYGDYLSEAVAGALNKTGCGGFMVDWFFNGPYRPQDARVKWLPCELQMWAELMDEPSAGKDVVTIEQETEFKRRAVERLRTRLRKAANVANPDCVIWLRCHDLAHPQLVDTQVFKEIRTVKDALYTNNRLTIGFPSTTCTTIELAIDGYYGASPAIRELEVFGD